MPFNLSPITFNLQPITSFFFPPLCVHCGREGAWLCPAAQQLLRREHPIINPLKIPGVDRVIVRGSYDCRPLQGLITKLKYNYWSALVEDFPEVINPLLPLLPKHSHTVIVPIPLHTRRQRERGFNQSQFLAEVLSQQSGLPVVHLIKRHRYTTPQAQLTEAERKTNILDAFEIDSRISEIPKSVVLIDDVITTGSTIAESATVLQKFGVRKIFAVSLAKG